MFLALFVQVQIKFWKEYLEKKINKKGLLLWILYLIPDTVDGLIESWSACACCQTLHVVIKLRKLHTYYLQNLVFVFQVRFHIIVYTLHIIFSQTGYNMFILLFSFFFQFTGNQNNVIQPENKSLKLMMWACDQFVLFSTEKLNQHTYFRLSPITK